MPKIRMNVGGECRSRNLQRDIIRSMCLLDQPTAISFGNLARSRGSFSTQLLALRGKEAAEPHAPKLLFLLTPKERINFFRYFFIPGDFDSLAKHFMTRVELLGPLWKRACLSVRRAPVRVVDSYLDESLTFYRTARDLSERAGIHADPSNYGTAFEELMQQYLKTGDIFIRTVLIRHLIPYFFELSAHISRSSGMFAISPERSHQTTRSSLTLALAQMRANGSSADSLSALLSCLDKVFDRFFREEYSYLVGSSFEMQAARLDHSEQSDVDDLRVSFNGVSHEDVRSAVKGLKNRRYRVIIELHYFEGLSFEEIAPKVGLQTADQAQEAHSLALLELKKFLERQQSRS